MENQIIQQLQDNMKQVKSGRFLMGGKVTLKNFYIGKYPITQKEWEAIMGNNPSHFKGDDLPVENVSWFDAQEFIKKLNKETKKNYRLPSEAEWEFAASGGLESKRYKYAGSNNLDEVGWFWENSGDTTHSVGQKKPNELGLYDMSGNVWEWCQDVWGDSYEGIPADGLARTQAGNDSRRVLRGGSWSLSDSCSVRYRFGIVATFRNFNLGFRLARY